MTREGMIRGRWESEDEIDWEMRMWELAGEKGGQLDTDRERERERESPRD